MFLKSSKKVIAIILASALLIGTGTVSVSAAEQSSPNSSENILAASEDIKLSEDTAAKEEIVTEEAEDTRSESSVSEDGNSKQEETGEEAQAEISEDTNTNSEAENAAEENEVDPLENNQPEILLENADETTGDLSLRLKGFTPAENQKVVVHLWTKSDYSDRVLYETTADGNDFVLQTNLSRHKYHTGEYFVKAYYKNTSTNTKKKVCEDSFTITPSATIKRSLTTMGKYEKLTLNDVKAYGIISSVRYAVWSKSNGQDDLAWYDAKINSSGNYYYSVPLSKHKGYGTYYADAYALTPAGDPVFLKQETFTVSPAKAESIEVSSPGSKGGFTVNVGKITAPGGVKSVNVAIWTKSDQSDLKWYTAVKSGDQFVVTSSMKEFAYSRNTYQIHVYVTDGRNKTKIVGEKTMLPANGSLKVEDVNGDNSNYRISLSGFKNYGRNMTVRIGVWSKVNGTDDLKWYPATLNNGKYTVEIDTDNHMDNGTYNVSVRVKDPNGTEYKVLTSTFEVTKLPEEEIKIKKVNRSAGTFTVDAVVKHVDTKGGVMIAIWSEDDQSNIFWYSAKKADAYHWTVNFDVQKHQYEFGKYYFHVYKYDKNATPTFVGDRTYTFKAKNYLAMEQLSEDKMKLTLYGANVDGTTAIEAQFPTWSEEADDNGNEMDDIVWYDGKKVATGVFTVTIDAAKHKSSGTYHTHIYLRTKEGGNKTCEYETSYELTYDDSEEHPGTYDSHAAEVMRNILFAVETGGQVYGNARYDAFTPAYKNTSNEKAITLGAGQHYATEAQKLLLRIYQKNPTKFTELDTAGIYNDLMTKNWSTYGSNGSKVTIKEGSKKARCLQAIISSKTGIKVQNQMMDELASNYISLAETEGVKDLKAKMFCANLCHLGGSKAMRRIIDKCKNYNLKLTVKNLWKVMQEDKNDLSSNYQVGDKIFDSRHKAIMGWLDQYID